MKRAIAALAGLVAVACSEAQPPPAAPPTPQAVVAIEPPKLRLGDVAVIEVTVVTPAGHEVAPVRPPAAVERLWLLDAETLPLESDGAREVRRTRIRVRAREAGSAQWPALAIEVKDAQGAATTLRTEPRAIDVVNALPAAPRVEPYSYRTPAATRGTPPLIAAAAGSAATLGALGAIAAARRWRRRVRARREIAERVAAAQPWVEALGALAAARTRAEAEWRDAGGEGARALRRYVARRFGVPAALSSPIEELATLPPPLVLAARWPSALACLRDFDADRFRALGAPDAGARVRAALDAAEVWVRSTIPADAALAEDAT